VQLEAALKDAKPIQFKENIALVLKYFDKLPLRSISWGLIGWRYGLMKRLAVNSLNLMERDRKFCIAQERAAGPCLKHVPRP